MLSCKHVSCAEDAVQVRRRTGRRCYGPASDAEFLRSIADKTPGREDDAGGQQMRRRQVYLKSYVFVTKDEAETKTTRGGRALVDAVCRNLPSLLLRHRKTHDDHGGRTVTAAAVDATCSSSNTSSYRRCAKKAAGKVLSQLLNRLLASCTCISASSSPSSSSFSSHASAAAADVRPSSFGIYPS